MYNIVRSILAELEQHLILYVKNVNLGPINTMLEECEN